MKIGKKANVVQDNMVSIIIISVIFLILFTTVVLFARDSEKSSNLAACKLSVIKADLVSKLEGAPDKHKKAYCNMTELGEIKLSDEYPHTDFAQEIVPRFSAGWKAFGQHGDRKLNPFPGERSPSQTHCYKIFSFYVNKDLNYVDMSQAIEDYLSVDEDSASILENAFYTEGGTRYYTIKEVEVQNFLNLQPEEIKFTPQKLNLESGRPYTITIVFVIDYDNFWSFVPGLGKLTSPEHEVYSSLYIIDPYNINNVCDILEN